MKQHLNTLYVQTEGAWLRREGETVVVVIDGVERASLPVHKLDGVVCFGRVGLSAPLMGFCAERNVAVSFLSPNGRFLARVVGPQGGNVLLRRRQYRLADDPDGAAAVAAALIVGKTLNQRTVLRRALRDHGPSMTDEARMSVKAAERRLTDVARRLRATNALDSVRGLEGEAGRSYFAVFDRLLRVADPALRFRGRSRRPPLDPVNAVLSFLYAMLGHDCRSAIEVTGLDAAVGFLHRDRPGRPGLALDLMEELRAPLADRLALSMFNRRQLGPRDFDRSGTGAFTLMDDARRRVLVAWQERKREEIHHPFLGERTAIGLIPSLQAQLLSRCLRGDLDGYPPFVWK
ncbi:type I-C CRISPR-associated endonuclease Cas1c [Minwuia thermotolerans]|uniref:CRISPR-associated endonuclease Cas1 n=1 Tax=Minwuia thermotolerans TaxID=2056226 RepID=A0A2M9G0M1_9PROT|nr:type I-C CRISPR-associated endonuclease Cas1c [Minwuia thermotolerans]PJK29224.1 subtype I-C CRISPR-associated endonuclease Cas1 [Minwuia thermotolerans]